MCELATAGLARPVGVYADAWIRAHGLEFALRAVVAWAGVAGHWDGFNWDAGDYVPTSGAVGVKTESGRTSYWNRGAAARLRAVLAAADEDTYRRSVALLETLRGDNQWRRLVTAFLAPTETAWVDQACADLDHRDSMRFLVWCSLGNAEQAAVMNARFSLEWGDLGMAVLATLADGLGTECAPILSKALTGYLDADQRRPIVEVLAHLPSDEAFTTLLDGRADRLFLGALIQTMGRFPDRAVRLMAPLLPTDPKLVPLVRSLLIAHPELLGSELPAEVAGLAAELARLPEADAGDLPPILVAPPWTRPRLKQNLEVLELAAPTEQGVAWRPGEREEWAARRHYSLRFSNEPVKRPSEDALSAGRNEWQTVRYFLQAPLEEARPLLARWTPHELWSALDCMGPIAVRFELDCLPQLLAVARQDPAGNGSLLLPFASLEIARLMADRYVRLKTARKAALAWLQRNGVRHLVPDALGQSGKLRTAAEAALRAVPEQAREAAAGYGPRATRLVEELLSADPADDLPRTIPTVGSWAGPAQLPQILLKDRTKALPAEAAGHVLTMLALSRPGEPYAGLAPVLAACDAESLEAFGWAAFEAWRQVGEPAKESWALTGLAVLGRDETVRRLTPIIRAWPGEGGHARAVAGLDVLAEIGTEVALMHLHGIGQRVKFKALKERARQKIDEVAESLGLTAEQLADRLVPDLGLGADGSTVLDYGPRRFTVGFDELLRPYVLDEAGRRRKDLPSPGAKDDPDMAPAAKKAFAALKKDVRTVASTQLTRLEEAQVTGRRWPAAEFTELLVGHPLMWHLVRRLVWTCEAGEFRVAEDRTFADVNDDPFELPGDATVRLAHPALLSGTLAAWAGVFADYEIIQPFLQLGRPVHALPADGFAAFTGRAVPVGRILGLTRRGWLRGTPQDAGVEVVCYRPLPEGRYLTIDLDPGIPVGYVEDLGDQRLERIRLTTTRDDAWGRQSLPVTDLDPVTASELLVDLHSLIAGK